MLTLTFITLHMLELLPRNPAPQNRFEDEDEEEEDMYPGHMDRDGRQDPSRAGGGVRVGDAIVDDMNIHPMNPAQKRGWRADEHIRTDGLPSLALFTHSSGLSPSLSQRHLRKQAEEYGYHGNYL